MYLMKYLENNECEINEKFMKNTKLVNQMKFIKVL